MTAPIRVLIVDDDALVRSALSYMLSGAEGIQVVGEAGDGEAAVNAVTAHSPDVVLMDIRMPRVDGLEATRRLRHRGVTVPIIVLTTFDADEYVLQALRAGANGFLLKDTPPPEIVTAVRRAAAGDAVLSPTVTRQLIDYVTATDPANNRRRERARALLDRLSDREREVAIAIGQGKSNAEISAELFMSVATVKAYVSRLLSKLEVSNRVQIALVAHDAELS